ncbi:MAG: hypothetical protein LC772_10610 [Chloroflexi bacterium]|nr:hypothetical protein [Chloroflexota bacterium]
MSMLWQRFTERAKRVVISAQEEAAHAGMPYVSPEHLLLGLVKENDSVATKVLERLGVAAARVRQEIQREIGARGYGRLNNNDVTLDPRMKRVLDFAYDEARTTNTNYIGTEHLLLGIIREGHGAAYHTLAKLGIDIVTSRREVQRYLGGVATETASGDTSATGRTETPQQASLEGYVAQKFTEPEAATSWLNEMAQKGFQLSSATSSDGALWLIMRGRIERDATPGSAAPAKVQTPSERASSESSLTGSAQAAPAADPSAVDKAAEDTPSSEKGRPRKRRKE